MKAPTPHIAANYGDFAKTVLMPGDPIRSRHIAMTYLENPVLVNDVRGVQGYTGYYKGKRVSVMASGMGQPAIGIYSYELFNAFGVESIIRVGSCGAFHKDLHLKDVVIAMGACTNSSYVDQYSLPGTFCPIADFELTRRAVEECEKKGIRYKVGNIFSSDVFYNADSSINEKYLRMGVLGVEMEAAALYMNAAYLGKRALAICTVSDHIIRGEELDAEARQKSFTEMMEIALNTAIKI